MKDETAKSRSFVLRTSSFSLLLSSFLLPPSSLPFAVLDQGGPEQQPLVGVGPYVSLEHRRPLQQRRVRPRPRGAVRGARVDRRLDEQFHFPVGQPHREDRDDRRAGGQRQFHG